MKIDHQENCEYRFSSISINVVDFHRFLLIHFNFSEKRNGQEICFVHDKRKGIQRKFLIVAAHFSLIQLLS